MPKEDRFFDLFCNHARVTLAGAEALNALLSGRAGVQSSIKDISIHEGKADEFTRQVLVALRRSFITPLDRGDIKDLIASMDDAIDQMNKTAKTIDLFELKSFEPCMQEMGKIIVRWNLAGNVVIAWIITMPATALMGAGFYGLCSAARPGEGRRPCSDAWRESHRRVAAAARDRIAVHYRHRDGAGLARCADHTVEACSRCTLRSAAAPCYLKKRSLFRVFNLLFCNLGNFLATSP
jgi:Protein of unknown function DUF47